LGSGCQQLELFESREAVSNRFSDFIVYVDESGDHGLKTVDQNYPVFALAFCVFTKSIIAKKWYLPFKSSSFDNSGMTWWCCTNSRFGRNLGHSSFQIVRQSSGSLKT